MRPIHSIIRTRRRRNGRVISVVLIAAAASLGGLLAPRSATGRQDSSSPPITRPAVSDQASPIETINPVARDGYRGLALLRKPPGNGPFPAVVIIHGGLTTVPRSMLETVVAAPMASRLLAAGYVVAAMTYRSRDADPQSDVSLIDSLAVVDHVRRLPTVDPKSTAIYGCSGGGDLALQLAASADVAAVAAEEPASVLFTGVLNKDVPKSGERLTPADAAPLMRDPERYYTGQFQALTRERIARLRAPILILQGDVSLETKFNVAVLIPELRQAGKPFDVITYPAEPHCFAFSPQSPRPAVALKAFQDADAFFRKHVTTQPKPIDAALVTQVPIGQPARPGSLAFVITTAGPTSTPFAGRWQAAFPASPDGTVQLSANGTSVTGTIALAAPAQSGSLQIYDGRIDGNAITFRVKSPTGGRTITFTGTMKGNDIVFTREVDVPPDGLPGGAGIFGAFGVRTFTATRAQ
jgi:dienelactone hydrolase